MGIDGGVAPFTVADITKAQETHLKEWEMKGIRQQQQGDVKTEQRGSCSLKPLERSKFHTSGFVLPMLHVLAVATGRLQNDLQNWLRAI